MWPNDDEGIPLRDPKKQRKGWYLLDKITGAIILDREGGGPIGVWEDKTIAGLLILAAYPYYDKIKRLTDIIKIPSPPPNGPFPSHVTLRQLIAGGRLRPKTKEEIQRDTRLAKTIKNLLERMRKENPRTNISDPKNI